jgi:tRNA/tmRNA/rRNA uracil-C5-methylase (TrmA/RlmC/RlmD family)
VCRIEGRVCFVAYGLPGDTIEVRIVRQAKGVRWGVIDRILEPSPDRVEASCPYFGTCGGCTWLHFAYPAQAEWKRRIVRDCLAHIAGIDVDVGWAEDPVLRLGYRTRAEFHAEEGRRGFYAAASHRVVDIARCPLCHDALNAALERLRSLAVRDSVEVVVNPEGPEVMVWTNHLRRGLLEVFEHVNSPSDRKPFRFLFDGTPVVNGSFSQSSLLLNRVLVGAVQTLAGDARTALDLYCGNGNLSLGLAARARVVGIDHNRAAVEAANEIGTGQYCAGDETAFREALTQAWDAVLLDPPRTGAKTIVPDLAACPAKVLVYVSCDPATLARDLKLLSGHGWRPVEVIAVDMFPNTAHVETVCRLERHRAPGGY